VVDSAGTVQAGSPTTGIKLCGSRTYTTDCSALTASEDPATFNGIKLTLFATSIT
jgi:hypothetical protein